MRARVKVWLEEGEQVFGEGVFLLLQGVREKGSISQAAQKLGMSYRQAWGRLKKAEQRLGFPLLEVQIGGEMGGGARLTRRAEQMVENYRKFREEVEAKVEELAARYFGPEG